MFAQWLIGLKRLRTCYLSFSWFLLPYIPPNFFWSLFFCFYSCSEYSFSSCQVFKGLLFQSTQRKLELVVLMEKNWLFMFWKKWHFVPLLSYFSAMTFEGLAICMLKFMHRIGLVRTFSKAGIHQTFASSWISMHQN